MPWSGAFPSTRPSPTGRAPASGRRPFAAPSAIFDNDPQYPFHRDLFEELAVVDYGDCLLDYGNHQKTPGTIEREAAKILDSPAPSC